MLPSLEFLASSPPRQGKIWRLLLQALPGVWQSGPRAPEFPCSGGCGATWDFIDARENSVEGEQDRNAEAMVCLPLWLMSSLWAPEKHKFIAYMSKHCGQGFLGVQSEGANLWEYAFNEQLPSGEESRDGRQESSCGA